MPPPLTIPDSDADSSTPEPSTSTSPEPALGTALKSSRKRSASPSPNPTNHNEAAPSSAPVPPAGGDEIRGPAVDVTKSGEEEPPLSDEAKAEERRGKRIEALKARNEELVGEVEAMEEKLEVERGKLKNPDAAATVKAHIRRLHAYNEIRDVGQGLIGLIAEQRGVRIVECYESGEFGVGDRD